MLDSFEIDLDPSEWDFRDIPVEEQELAVVYEYCREVPEVSRRIADWLDGERMLIGDYVDEVRGYDQELVGQGASVRKSLAAELNGELSITDDEEWAPSEIKNHRIWGIRYILTEWPEPYLVARDNCSVKLGIERLPETGLSDELKLPLAPLGQLRASNTETCQVPKSFGGLSNIAVAHFSNLEGQPTYGFDIDMSFKRTEIVDAFKAWLKEEHARVGREGSEAERTGPGRKQGKRLPTASLNALSALRLTQRGQTGKVRAFAWVDDAVKDYVELEDSQSLASPRGVLPLFSSQKGFDEAIERAQMIKRTFLFDRV